MRWRELLNKSFLTVSSYCFQQQYNTVLFYLYININSAQSIPFPICGIQYIENFYLITIYTLPTHQQIILLRKKNTKYSGNSLSLIIYKCIHQVSTIS